MNLATLPVGSPEAFIVLIEVAAGSGLKYEYDEQSGALVLDFVLHEVGMPANYGLIPSTKAADGDHVDVLVYTHEPLLPGTLVTCRALGMMLQKDRGQQDNKIIGVPVVDKRPRFETIEALLKVEEQTLRNFYAAVAEQKQKEIVIAGFVGAAEAQQEIIRCTASE